MVDMPMVAISGLPKPRKKPISVEMHILDSVAEKLPGRLALWLNWKSDAILTGFGSFGEIKYIQVSKPAVFAVS